MAFLSSRRQARKSLWSGEPAQASLRFFKHYSECLSCRNWTRCPLKSCFQWTHRHRIRNNSRQLWIILSTKNSHRVRTTIKTTTKKIKTGSRKRRTAAVASLQSFSKMISKVSMTAMRMTLVMDTLKLMDTILIESAWKLYEMDSRLFHKFPLSLQAPYARILIHSADTLMTRYGRHLLKSVCLVKIMIFFSTRANELINTLSLSSFWMADLY